MRKIKLNRIFGGGSVGSLVLLLFAILACPGFSGANAVADDITANDVFDTKNEAVTTAETGQTTQVWVKPSLSIALAGTMNIESTGDFASGFADLAIATNSKNGFSVSVNSVDYTDLVDVADSAHKIPTIGSISKQSEFPAVGWGYYVDSAEPNANSEYRPATTSAVVAKSTTTSGPSNTLKVAVGVKINPETSIGMYKNTLMVSVLANPTAITSLTSLTRMQDMTPEICAETPKYVDINNYSKKQLTDSRDGKKYWVAKLKDNNCWMTDNLALNLGSSVTLTPINSDVSTNKAVTSHWIAHQNTYWLYSWDAATAESGASVTAAGLEAKDSICPKGWQLPLAGVLQNGTNTDNATGSFMYLLKLYGVTNYSTMVSIGEVVPLTFVRAGYAANGTSVGGVGAEGDYWSRVSSDSNRAYQLLWYNGGNLFQTRSYLRSDGDSVRCIARQVAR